MRRGGWLSRSGSSIALCVLSSAYVLGQAQEPRLPPAPANPRPASISSPDDPGLPALIATCKTPPPPRGGGRGGGGGAQPPGPRDYTVSAIPGVIAAGERWRFLWQEAGNNGDGIVGTDDGGLLIAQNDNSEVVKLDPNGRPSVVYSDTHTGGSLSINTKGALFIVARGLRTAIVQLAPRRAGTGGPVSGRCARLQWPQSQRPDGRQQGRRVLHHGRRVLRRPERRGDEIRREHHAERHHSQRRREDRST